MCVLKCFILRRCGPWQQKYSPDCAKLTHRWQRVPNPLFYEDPIFFQIRLSPYHKIQRILIEMVQIKKHTNAYQTFTEKDNTGNGMKSMKISDIPFLKQPPFLQAVPKSKPSFLREFQKLKLPLYKGGSDCVTMPWYTGFFLNHYLTIY